MESLRFDAVARALGTRRGILAGVLAVAPAVLDAQARRKKKKKLKENAFGCVNVGGKCRGRDRQCCSGICQGKKPKKGKKDRSRCAAHDAGDCAANDDQCAGGFASCTTSAGLFGFCFRTTGQASYCAAEDEYACRPCRRDADCRPFCGPAAACIACDTCGESPTICAGPVNCTF